MRILSPVDSGSLQTSPLQNPPHHTPFGGDWAADIASDGAMYARFANPSGDLVLTVEREFEPCSTPDSGGRAVTVGVSVGGTRVGEVFYVHLGSVEVGLGVIANGTKLGDMVTRPRNESRCWGNVHTHIEPRNVAGRSCFLPRNLNTDITATTPLGLLGGAWAEGGSAACAVGGLTSVTRTDTGVRLVGWARFPHVPDESVHVEALVDRRPAGTAIADAPLEVLGPHGFDFTVPATGASHAVCASVRGVAGAADVTLAGCQRV